MNIAKTFLDKLKNDNILILNFYNNVIQYVVLRTNATKIFVDEYDKTTNTSFIIEKSKKFNKIHIVISPEQRIYEQIKINSKIKDQSSINSIIKKELSNKYKNSDDIIYKYYKENEENEETYFVVDGFYKNEFLKYENILNDLKKVEFSTIDTYSFNSIVELCNKQNTPFISIHEENNKIIIIANDSKKVLFSRIIDIDIEQDTNNKNLQIIENIIKNYKFIVQKVLFSENECKNIFLIGKFSEDDFVLSILKENIKDINISTIYPYTFIKGIKHTDFYDYLKVIGTVIKNDLYDFTPHFINRKIQINLLKNFFMFVFFILFSFNIFNFIEIYTDFTDLKIKNDFLKNEYKKHTNKVLYNINELKKIEDFYNLKLSFYNNNLIADLKFLYEFLIKFDRKNIDITFNENKKNMNITVNKKFKNLLELNIFVQNLASELKDNKYDISNVIDYKELSLSTMFSYNLAEQQKSVSKNDKDKRKRKWKV